MPGPSSMSVELKKRFGVRNKEKRNKASTVLQSVMPTRARTTTQRTAEKTEMASSSFAP